MATDSDWELSERNEELLEHILRDPLTEHWESTDHKPYVLNEVSESSHEYFTVENLFSDTARRMPITKIERVENPYLLGHYILKREKMEDGIDTVCESSLFHGTRNECVDGICRFNFDWRKRGSSTGHKFGQGVSFTPEVSYAQHYTPYGENVLILAKVLKKNETLGNSFTEVPDEPFDTTTNGKDTVFVKYEDDDFYPQYVIHFDR